MNSKTPPILCKRQKWKNIVLVFLGASLALGSNAIVRKIKRVKQERINALNRQKPLTFLTDDERKQITTNPDHIRDLYQLMKDIHEIFEKYKIPYLIEAGTFLGAVRHQGIIPWDDDLDISIMDTDVPKFLKLRPILRKLGYEIKKWNACDWYIQRINKLSYITPSGHKVYAYCDVIVKIKNKSGFLISKNPNNRRRWPNEYWRPEEYKIPQLYSFGSFRVWGASLPYSFLNRFAPDWSHKAWCTFKHNGETQKPFIFKLAPKDFKPAQPLGPLEDRVR